MRSRLVLAGLVGFVTLGVASPVLAQDNPEALLTKAGCLACHTKDKKLVGPAYKDVAAKYKGQADAVPKLVEKTRKGGAGVYGPVPMPPNPVNKISDAELKSAIEWILKL